MYNKCRRHLHFKHTWVQLNSNIYYFNNSVPYDLYYFGVVSINDSTNWFGHGSPSRVWSEDTANSFIIVTLSKLLYSCTFSTQGWKWVPGTLKWAGYVNKKALIRQLCLQGADDALTLTLNPKISLFFSYPVGTWLPLLHFVPPSLLLSSFYTVPEMCCHSYLRTEIWKRMYIFEKSNLLEENTSKLHLSLIINWLVYAFENTIYIAFFFLKTTGLFFFQWFASIFKINRILS